MTIDLASAARTFNGAPGNTNDVNGGPSNTNDFGYNRALSATRPPPPPPSQLYPPRPSSGGGICASAVKVGGRFQ